ncbi:MAG: protein kinase, partial [Nannocystaceae bacterium]
MPVEPELRFTVDSEVSAVRGGFVDMPVSKICEDLSIEIGEFDGWRRRIFERVFERVEGGSPGRGASRDTDSSDATRFAGGRAAAAQAREQEHRGRPPNDLALDSTTSTVQPVRDWLALTDPMVGALVGPYVINDTLGKGGMGCVYRAFDRRLNRQVAIKVLHGDLGRSEQQRLVREAQAMAQLGHPNVVQVHEVGEHEGRAFVVMEMVEGQTLSTWQRSEPRPDWRACVQVYLQAGAGLAAAHEQGLVHRDFKPSNALVDERGRVRVLDFGLVGTSLSLDDGPTVDDGLSRGEPRSFESLDWVSERLTQTGAVMGTPAYMSPEQIRGEEVDARSDQFSFCVSLYEAVYGQRPFVGKDLGMLACAVRDGRLAPVESDTRVPARLAAALLRGLAYEPSERWSSMEALLAELRRQVTPPRVRRWVASVGLGGAALAGMLALGLGVQVSEQGEQLTEKEAVLAEKVNELHEQLAAQKGLRAKDAAREGGRELEAVRLAVQAFEGLAPEANLPTETFEGLAYALAEVDRGLALRGHTARVYAVATSADGERIATGSQDRTVRIWSAHSGAPIRTLEGHERTVRAVAFSSDAVRLASASDDGTARIWDATTGQLLESLRHDGAVMSVALSPDGTRVATASGNTLWLWTLDDDAVVVPFVGHTGRVRSVGWSPDGARLYTASEDHTVGSWDARTGALLETLDGHTDEVLDVAVSSDGTRIATGGRDETARVWDAGTGMPLAVFEPAQVVDAVDFSPDGTRLVTGTFDDGAAQLWDIATGRASTVAHHEDAVFDVAFSPSGDQLVTGSWDGTARSWNLEPSEALLTLPHSRRVDAVALSRDGTRLAVGSGDGTTRVWDARSGTQLLTLEGHRIDVLALAWSPDDQTLATASWDGSVRLWDARSGAHRRTLQGHHDPVRAVRWSEDGTRLVTASRDGTARVWDASAGTEVRSVSHGAALVDAMFDPSGQGLLTVGADDRIRGWGVDTEQPQPYPGIDSPSTALAYSPDRTRMAIAAQDGTVSIRDRGSGQELVRLLGHTGPVGTVVFSDDGTRLATGSEDTTARVWDVASGERQGVFPHEGAVTSVALSPDGLRLATASGERQARVWALQSDPWLSWGCAVLEGRQGHDPSSERACAKWSQARSSALVPSEPSAEHAAPTVSVAPDLDVPPSITVHGVELALVPGGTFTMGSPAGEQDRHGSEGPQHEVTIDSFYLARTEVTNGQYALFLEANPDAHRPSSYKDERVGASDQPVT